MNGGVLVSSTVRSLPWATAQTRLVAIGRHDVEHFHLALHDLAIGLIVDELQVGPAAEDRIAVGRAVALEPGEILVEDRLAQLLERASAVERPRLAAAPNSASSMIRASCRSPCSFRWMPLIVSGLFALRVELQRRREQIDERHAVRLRPPRPWRPCRA